MLGTFGAMSEARDDGFPFDGNRERELHRLIAAYCAGVVLNVAPKIPAPIIQRRHRYGYRGVL
ncbi:hypothetical protein LCGC14_2873960, partial [marine sediment metagenome]